MNTPEQTINACATAVLAGDDEAADRHWREFVRMLWAGMPGVPWVKTEEAKLP